MKRYEDYKEDKSKEDLTKEELNNIPWTRFKIIVPTQEEKDEIIEAIEHLHYADIDTDFITVNQLVHEYLEGTNIIVDEKLYNSLK